MPELVDGENILLADDGEGIAAQIARAADDVALRRRIGAAGLDTLRRVFNPERVVGEMIARMRKLDLEAERRRAAS
jgi:hypothetical protein